jgi:hypothetical protein
MTNPKNKPAPKIVRKWVPKIATPAKALIRSNQVKKYSHAL